MGGMTFTHVAPRGRGTRTWLDRLARGVIDADGDLYGDERERLRWYEGIALTATLQWVGVPTAAAVLVWTLGRPAVLPLAVVSVVMYLPMLLLAAYVRSRRVATTVRTWNGKAVLSAALFAVPYVIFMVGCVAAYADDDSGAVRGAGLGALLGGLIGTVVIALMTRRRRRREAMSVPDVD